MNHSEYNPMKSKAYLRVIDSNDLAKKPELERLEKARKAIDTRKHYSEIVKDIFFKDALLSNKSAHQEVPKQIMSLKDIKEAADKRRKDEYEHHKLMHELGKRYLDDVRHQNMNITPETRKKMDEKRFLQMKSVEPQKKSRKFLDQVSRKFNDPRDMVVQRDLIKKLNPTSNSDSQAAFLHNVKYFDEKLIDQETKLRYKATREEAGLELGDKYINSIQNKLNILEKEANIDKKKDKLDAQASKRDERKAVAVSTATTDVKQKDSQPDAKVDAKPADTKPGETKPTDPKATDKTKPTPA